VVERNLAKVEVVGSSPITRSTYIFGILLMHPTFILYQSSIFAALMLVAL
jgi:hypothetical protein